MEDRDIFTLIEKFCREHIAAQKKQLEQEIKDALAQENRN